MVSLAQFGYSDPAQQNGREAILAGVRSDSQAMNLDRLNSSVSATEAGANANTGFAKDFDFVSFGQAKQSEAGYTMDSDREIAPEQQEVSAEVLNLQAYQGLRSMGFTHDEIYDAQSRFGVTNEQMFENASKGDKQELVPEEKQAELESQNQAQQMAKDFQLAMQVPESEKAKDGVKATMAGLETSVDIGRMAFA